MNTIELIPKNFIKYGKRKARKRFLLIGSDSIKHRKFLRRIIIPKLKKQYNAKVPGFWATLGFADGTLKNWTGSIDVSEYGNDSVKGLGKNLIRYLRDFFELNEESGIVERFVSFEKSQFKFPDGEFHSDQIPKLRLTIMLDANETALVYYQHKDSETGEEFPEFIMPEPTAGNTINNRDRLTYYFNALSDKQLDSVNRKKNIIRLSEKQLIDQFKIKVLTFKRKEFVDTNEFVNFIKSKVYKGNKNDTHTLLKFNPNENTFSKVVADEIDAELKTLLLIHGTFATTEQSFASLYTNGNYWLKNLMLKENNTYKQIIAFDHPTITDDAEMNIGTLFYMLGENFKFKKDVDIIASSQGGLLAQYLASISNEDTKIPVGKVVLVSSANGVDYFKTGEHIAKFLTVMMHSLEASGKIFAAFIVALATQSADYFLKLPGSVMMTPGSDKLKSILEAVPSNKNTLFFLVITDFDKHSNIQSGFLKIVFKFLSLLVYPIMGKYNDLVVRTKNQYQIHKDFCCIKDYNPNQFKSHIISALHGNALESDSVKQKISDFLSPETSHC